jgi:hypothetical protein
MGSRASGGAAAQQQRHASARPAVMPVSRRCAQAWRRSSSMPAIHTNSITAHQATPLSDCTTAGREHEVVVGRERRAQHARPEQDAGR